ncbi:uncharacterized protein LOC131663851 [Phymastichus coffea]|uniref:uncharacterized protein LOC131663851 n=1 Tax=Phymastichus coffea TaxID=108790 RepID=UPI00273CDE3A|nr:uncharacterized protein LOC131663851 [Phymastichus coffea]XP_058790540.1 uncharacterized protein LOC131663851 [Phymastichus coffea]
MADVTDFNEWLEKIECPKTCTSILVMNTLQRGVLGLLWEDLSKTVRPYYEVVETRKNILHYKIRKEPKDPLIQSVRNVIHLKDEREKLNEKIKIAQEKWQKQEYLCRQKANLLEKKKEERQNLEIKKEIFKIKIKQMSMEIQNCVKMKDICKNLMPPTVDNISQHTLIECLSFVSNYSGGPEKRKIWNTISELLGPIKIPVLFNAILALRTYYTDLLIHLDIEENCIKAENVANIDRGIAEVCSEHISNVANRHIYAGRMKSNEEITMDYVERIEEIIEELRPDLTDWLPLALEVKKLEILKSDLERELEIHRDQVLEKDFCIDDTLTQLVNEIKNVDNEMAECIEKVQNAFEHLKLSGISILKKKESLLSEVKKFKLIQTGIKHEWLGIDISNELEIFNDINFDTLRKIMLKGETGAYKHLQTCLNRASIVVDIRCGMSVSNFPMLRVPVYYLIDFYKTYLANVSLSKRISEGAIDIFDNTPESPVDPPTVISNVPYQCILEMLKLTHVNYQRTLQHSEEFEQVLKTWTNQTMRDIVSKIFNDKTVYGATLEEWQKRFSSTIYVLQQSNNHLT